MFNFTKPGGLHSKFMAWRERRYWRRRQLDFVRQMVSEDWRWLGANPIADELTTRYRAALDTHWYVREHEPVSAFRERLRKKLGANTFSLGAPGNAGGLTEAQKLRNIRNALYAEQLRESLQTLLDLCAIGDVDENTEVHGWGDAIKRAKALIEADAALPDGVSGMDGQVSSEKAPDA